MIESIKGILLHKDPVNAVLETASGLSFELLIPISTFEILPAVGEACQLFTHLHISQDDVRLFGFASTGERELYRQLNRVSGIGPKSALSIISTMPISTFVKAVERDETAILTKIPGIGMKSAQRLIIELKGKLRHILDIAEPGGAQISGSKADEVENALQTLGFNAREVRQELSLMGEEAETLNAEQLIKEVIRRLYQRRK